MKTKLTYKKLSKLKYGFLKIVKQKLKMINITFNHIKNTYIFCRYYLILVDNFLSS